MRVGHERGVGHVSRVKDWALGAERQLNRGSRGNHEPEIRSESAPGAAVDEMADGAENLHAEEAVDYADDPAMDEGVSGGRALSRACGAEAGARRAAHPSIPAPHARRARARRTRS